MGQISDKYIEMKPKLDEMLKISKDCNTTVLNKEKIDYMYRCFLRFKPLRHDREILTFYEKNGKKHIAIGSFIRWDRSDSIKRHGHKGLEMDESMFFDFIAQHGHGIAQHVRGPIREYFKKLVDLTIQLHSYKSTEQSLAINRYINVCNIRGICNEVKINSYYCYSVDVSSDTPTKVTLNVENPNKTISLNIADIRDHTTLEDILDEVHSVYKSVESEVYKIKEHNNNVINQMERVLYPLTIKEKLKNG